MASGTGLLISLTSRGYVLDTYNVISYILHIQIRVQNPSPGTTKCRSCVLSLLLVVLYIQEYHVFCRCRIYCLGLSEPSLVMTCLKYLAFHIGKGVSSFCLIGCFSSSSLLYFYLNHIALQRFIHIVMGVQQNNNKIVWNSVLVTSLKHAIRMLKTSRVAL